MSIRSDLDDSLKFLSIMGMHDRAEQMSLAVRVRALIRILISSGAVDKESFAREIEEVLPMEKERISRLAVVRVAEAANKRSMEPSAVDCGPRRAACRSACCKLEFALSKEDIEDGIRFSYRQPYLALKGDDGYCHHMDRDTGMCGIYEARPAICRTYSCEGDSRIWSDFGKLIPADSLLEKGGACP